MIKSTVRLSRRKALMIGSTGLATVATETKWACAQGEHVLDFDTLQAGDHPDFSGSWNEILPFGTNPPTGVETTAAQRILERAPTGKPIDIATYFLGLSGRDQRYIGGWPDRWNPVIVAFFTATKTHPTGDVTPWCAAFVNWCLKRAGVPFPENASSGSFRRWQTQTTTPVRGDIAVFQRTDPSQAKLGRGHVGFVIDEDAHRVRILGGNQITKQGHHQISEVWFKKAGSIIELHSYRTVSNI